MSVNLISSISGEIVELFSDYVKAVIGNDTLKINKLRSKYKLLIKAENELINGCDYDTLGNIFISASSNDNDDAKVRRAKAKISSILSDKFLTGKISTTKLGWDDFVIEDQTFNANSLLEAIISIKAFASVRKIFDGLDTNILSTQDRNFVNNLDTVFFNSLTEFCSNSPSMELLFLSYGFNIPDIDLNFINEMASTKSPNDDTGEKSLAMQIDSLKSSLWHFCMADAPLGEPVFRASNNKNDIYSLLFNIARLEILAPYIDVELLNALCYLLEFGIRIGKFDIDTANIIKSINNNFHRVHGKNIK